MNNYKPIDRPSWDEFFLLHAILQSRRSGDAQTKMGCVLVKDNTILSGGYNGVMRGVIERNIPNVRPSKYPFFIHAEHNSLLNCARNGVSTIGATSYTNERPCSKCIQYLYQAGIKKVVYTRHTIANMLNEEEDELYKFIVKEIHKVKPEFEVVEYPIKELEKKFPEIRI